MIRQVTLYEAICDECRQDFGNITGSDDSLWADEGSAFDAVQEYDWLDTVKGLLCFGCAKCEVCGDEPTCAVERHAVCAEHEDHAFEVTP